jgi:hypothetical protein
MKTIYSKIVYYLRFMYILGPCDDIRPFWTANDKKKIQNRRSYRMLENVSDFVLTVYSVRHPSHDEDRNLKLIRELSSSRQIFKVNFTIVTT